MKKVLIAGFWAYQGTYCRFFYPANRLEGWSSMEKVLIAGFWECQKRHGVGFGCRERIRTSDLPGMSRTLSY
jgi:hypothetical protein